MAIKLANLPPKANEMNIYNWLENKHKINGLKDCKIVLDRDEQLYSKRIAWLATDNRDIIKKVLYLHNKIFAGYTFKCYIMGYPYQTLMDEDDEDDTTDIQLERKLLKMKYEEEKQKQKQKAQ